MENVMHVPEADAQYFSVMVLLEKGGQILFEKMGFTIFLHKMQIASGYSEGRLFWFDASALNAHV